MKNQNTCAAISLLVALCVIAPNALATIITTFDHGWYNAEGSHTPTNTNIWTGAEGANPGSNTNHFLAFDLTSAAGQTVTGATLTYYAGNGSYNSSDSSETVNWFDFTGSVDDLLAGTGGVPAYSDLADGSVYGAETVFGRAEASPGAGDPMPEVTSMLSASAISDMNTVLADADKRFIMGASIITSIFGEQQKLWWGSGNEPAAQLELTFGQLPIPEPSTLAIFALGMFGLAARRFKK